MVYYGVGKIQSGTHGKWNREVDTQAKWNKDWDTCRGGKHREQKTRVWKTRSGRQLMIKRHREWNTHGVRHTWTYGVGHTLRGTYTGWDIYGVGHTRKRTNQIEHTE